MDNEQYQSIIRAIIALLEDCDSKADVQKAIKIIMAMQTPEKKENS